MNNNTEAVVGTNNDATLCKLSAVGLGYYPDPFVKYFVKKPERRPPLINRGYASRVIAIENILKQFFQLGGDKKQVVSLGAGFDTTFFRLKSSGISFHGFYEIDYKEVVQNKISIIMSHRELSNLINTPSNQDKSNSLHGADYHLFAADLNNLEYVESNILAAGIDMSLPTIFFSECVIIYLEPHKGTSLIRWAAEKFPISAFVTYEQILPHDPFGQMMVKNLEVKGCGLLSIHEYPDLKAQQKRYTEAGWQIVKAEDMYDIYSYMLPRSDISRIGKLEMFDEIEEWILIQRHYCIIFASKDTNENNTYWESACKLFDMPGRPSSGLISIFNKQ